MMKLDNVSNLELELRSAMVQGELHLFWVML
jgi:hypothetical protein